ncbi:MAG: tyrosine--tRNA ligase, partial [Muribaculaceae bacterium]|nr:tyrosine--tRNA ligase [Muribaculaceae bacterium]
DEKTLLDIFDCVPTSHISRESLNSDRPLLELLAVDTNVFPSKGEARKMIQGGGVSINKEKVTDPNAVINADALLNGKYILAQRGKKNYHLIIAD